MSQLMLQAPGSQNSGTGTWQDIRFSGRAVEQNVIRYDGIEGSAIIDAAPGNLNGEIPTPFKLQASLENVQEFRVESNNYPAEYGTGTGGQVSVVTKSGSQQLSTARCSSTCRNDALDAPNYFDNRQALPQVAARAESVRRVVRRSDREGPGVLLRQLRRLPARRRASTSSRRCRARRVGARRAGDRAAASRLPAPNAAHLCRQRRPTRTSTSRSCRRRRNVRENAFSGRLDFRLGTNWSTYVRVFHDQGTNDQPEGVTGRTVHVTTTRPTRVCNLQGILGSGDAQRVQVRLQRRADRSQRHRADGQRHRPLEHRRST